MTREQMMRYLAEYPRRVRIMEVCGTHTRSIQQGGIRSLISPNIQLVSGPGCPVCVTPAGYMDALAECSLKPDTCVVSFADLFRVRGKRWSFSQARAQGGQFREIYAPLDVLKFARQNPHVQYVVAAVGFETTVPIYAVLMESLLREGIKNVRLMTSLRTMPPALSYLCRHEAVDAFLCPGHVSALIGSDAYISLAAEYHRPFVVAGFESEHILLALCRILMQLDAGEGKVENVYPGAVSERGNEAAMALVRQYFEPADGIWRGIGLMEGSALVLRRAHRSYEVGYIDVDETPVSGCRCTDVMLGRICPDECALFGISCTPMRPVGACMVSGEGACGIWYANRGEHR